MNLFLFVQDLVKQQLLQIFSGIKKRTASKSAKFNGKGNDASILALPYSLRFSKFLVAVEYIFRITVSVHGLVLFLLYNELLPGLKRYL